MPDQPTIYLPRMRTRPGFKHSYQAKHGQKVTVVDATGRTAPAGQDPTVITTAAKPTTRGRTTVPTIPAGDGE